MKRDIRAAMHPPLTSLFLLEIALLFLVVSPRRMRRLATLGVDVSSDTLHTVGP